MANQVQVVVLATPATPMAPPLSIRSLLLLALESNQFKMAVKLINLTNTDRSNLIFTDVRMVSVQQWLRISLKRAHTSQD